MYGVASAERVDIEKREDFVGFEELEAGDIACCFYIVLAYASAKRFRQWTFDDLAEDTSCHFCFGLSCFGLCCVELKGIWRGERSWRGS